LFDRITEASLRLEHRHSDGSWGRFERSHHDAADHDQERDWSKGKIVYACTRCDEIVRVDVPPDEPGASSHRS
jgi:hypothetical protein